ADQEAVMRVQRVTASDGGPESWTVVDETFAAVDPVDAFLAHLTVIERSPGTVRSYAFDLRDYFEFLTEHGIDWRHVRIEHLGRFVGWLRLAPAWHALPVLHAPGSTPSRTCWPGSPPNAQTRGPKPPTAQAPATNPGSDASSWPTNGSSNYPKR